MPAAVPISIIVIGAVTKVRLSSNIEIETNETEMKARVRPLLNSAWQMDSITTLFMFCFAFSEELLVFSISVGYANYTPHASAEC